ncbi:MAG TPA: hypothetical protein VN812_21060 [Candidatus Acidoferrales bacterium]|nr:hypothetical protein [Candidatus Acidoferrales bacterium]
MTQRARFVLAGTPRSGSNWLISALRGHPDIVCEGEVLDDPYLKDHPEFAADLPRGLANLWQPARSGQRAVGFKLFYFHCWDYYQEKRGIWSTLRDDKDIRIVLLTRNNLLALALSWKKARLTGQWLIRERPVGEATQPLELDPAELWQMFEHIEAGMRRMDQIFLGHPQLRVTYEVFFGDPVSHLNDIQDFLGVARRPLRAELLKQETAPLHHAIRNFAALKQAFADTRFSHFFG